MKNLKKLLELIETLKNSEVKNLIDERIKEFKENKKLKDKIFSELCFCILTANSSAEKCIKIQNGIGNDFSKLSEKKLAEKLRKFGYRFPNARAKYIAEARNCNLNNVINPLNDEKKLRGWLVKNVKGIGMKEASHFLRNIGFSNLAIIDFHIIELLERYGLLKKPKTLTENKYTEIEALLREISEKSNLSLAELDLYLWYVETGKVLK